MTAPACHPFLSAWDACGDSFGEVLDRWTGEWPEELRTLQLACDAVSRRRPFAEALQALEATDLDAADPDIANALLLQWAVILRILGRPVPDWIRRKGHALVGPQTPLSLRSAAAMRDEHAPGMEGNILAQLRLREESVANFPAGHPRYWRLLGNLGNLLADLGRLSEIAEPLRVLEAHGPQAGELLRLDWFTDHVMAGRHAEAQHLLPRVLGPDRTFRAYDERTRETACLLGFLRAEAGAAAPPAAAPGEPGWAPTVRWLLAGDPTAALQAARAFAATPRGAGELANESGLSSMNLIRAELAAGNGDAAHRLLQTRHARGNLDPFDGILLARCAVLDGRWEDAHGHFRAALEAADRYRAHGRVAFELALARELRPGDQFRLAHGAGHAEPVPRATAVPGPSPVGLERLVGPSEALAAVRAQVLRFAPLDATVLVLGETGTGKDLVARALHDVSPRAAAPFVDINCSSLPELLIESELFGHVRGAFTGATEARAGLFEAAGAGTLFLDEIGDLPLVQQARLLRVLETREVRPVGGTAGRPVACRVVAATNVDLARKVADGAFRADLLYRLRRLSITIPPLRERPDDIVPLALHFLMEGRPAGRRVRIAESLREALAQRPWPGNVRELRGAMERLRILNSDADAYDLASFARTEPTEPTPAAEAPAPPLPEWPTAPAGRGPMRRRERLDALLQRHRRLTRLEAAEILGVAPATAGRDLHGLVAEGRALLVRSGGSRRSQYFEAGG